MFIAFYRHSIRDPYTGLTLGSTRFGWNTGFRLGLGLRVGFEGCVHGSSWGSRGFQRLRAVGAFRVLGF